MPRKNKKAIPIIRVKPLQIKKVSVNYTPSRPLGRGIPIRKVPQGALRKKPQRRRYYEDDDYW